MEVACMYKSSVRCLGAAWSNLHTAQNKRTTPHRSPICRGVHMYVSTHVHTWVHLHACVWAELGKLHG